mmetsp:Transcript_1784/g.3993  ORF Transcript_1784/g.3993 Transcript_1784/m.3993 type:complete len:296 (+) Transcript_1784:20-907(+)|eukprot:CAMPEP_0204475394 /NCGR_PEP_ID=MMETSP0471-20130131/28315_1 /ASSEMBLY_ACC=CAM_ASM_000602 /TAXON_ID=2969 /ORGANISM="Oxyrrhis marina" /LENGTH=295 /DNA_ID=CAMNT_0051477873 /DNA_START=26 /DNA_END=913 /DNA_ORIENTATION=-
MSGPTQQDMGGEAQVEQDTSQPVKLERARVRRLCVAMYVTACAAHLAALYGLAVYLDDSEHSVVPLVIMCIALIFDNLTVAVGALPAVSDRFRLVLEYMGRIRFLVVMLAWPFLMTWHWDLACHCGVATAATASLAWHLGMFLVGFFILREVAFAVRGMPEADNTTRQFGDCMPTNALIGGSFRADPDIFTTEGLVVFRPYPPRAGAFAPAGLAIMSAACIGLLFPVFSGLGMHGCVLLAGVGGCLACRLRANMGKGNHMWSHVAEVVWIAAAAGQLYFCQAHGRFQLCYDGAAA